MHFRRRLFRHHLPRIIQQLSTNARHFTHISENGRQIFPLPSMATVPLYYSAPMTDNASRQQSEYLSALPDTTHNQDHGYAFDARKVNRYYRLLTRECCNAKERVFKHICSRDIYVYFRQKSVPRGSACIFHETVSFASSYNNILQNLGARSTR